jgi:hypothetical protein
MSTSQFDNLADAATLILNESVDKNRNRNSTISSYNTLALASTENMSAAASAEFLLNFGDSGANVVSAIAISQKSTRKPLENNANTILNERNNKKSSTSINKMSVPHLNELSERQNTCDSQHIQHSQINHTNYRNNQQQETKSISNFSNNQQQLQRTTKKQKTIESLSLPHHGFKNIPALNGHMRLHGGFFKQVF